MALESSIIVKQKRKYIFYKITQRREYRKLTPPILDRAKENRITEYILKEMGGRLISARKECGKVVPVYSSKQMQHKDPVRDVRQTVMFKG